MSVDGSNLRLALVHAGRSKQEVYGRAGFEQLYRDDLKGTNMAESELLDAETSTELTVASKYGITKAVIQDAIDAANDLAATNPTDKAGIESVRRYRLDVLRPMRITVDKKHDEIKKEALEYCRVTDRVAKELKAMIEPAEQRLQEIEDAPKREAARLAKEAEEARKVELHRRIQLAFGVRWPMTAESLDALSPAEFEAAYLKEKERFDGEQKAHADAQAAIQAEKERQAAIAKEQAERQAEIDRREAELKEQQRKIDEANRLAREKIVTTRMQQLAAVNSVATRDEVAAMVDEQFASYLADMTTAFNEEKVAKAAAAKARQEQEARELEARELEARIERQAAERAAKIEAERVAEEQRKQALKEKAEAAARRKAARAPDREKIIAYVDAIESVALPDVKDVDILQQVTDASSTFASTLQRIAASLE